MSGLNFPIAFGAGLVSFFAPCVLPLLPAYISYVTGVSFDDLKSEGRKYYIKKIFFSSIFYILGFSLIFVLLGTAAGGIGASLRRYNLLVQRIGGAFILVFGLEFAGILKIPFLSFQKSLKLPSWSQNLGYLRSFIVGVIFATAWTPCVGAILGSILALAAVTGTVVKGASLLFVYSLGISLPFLIVAMTLASATSFLDIIKRNIGTVTKVAGLVLAILGGLLLTDTYKFVNTWLFNIAFKFGYQIK